MNCKHTGGNCYEPKQTNMANIKKSKVFSGRSE